MKLDCILLVGMGAGTLFTVVPKANDLGCKNILTAYPSRKRIRSRQTREMTQEQGFL